MSEQAKPTGTASSNGDANGKAAGQAAEPDKPVAKPTISHVFGEIVWLMTQSQTHKHFALSDLEWMIMPPVLLSQFRIFRDKANQPVGVAFWAFLSEESERKLKEGATRLRPDEWKSGDRAWLVNVIAPQATKDNKIVEAMLSDLKQKVFENRSLNLHRTDPKTGKKEVVTLG